MSAVPAYRYAERAPQRAPRRPKVNVVPGKRANADTSAASSLIFLVKTVAVVLVVVAVLGFVRVYMNAATVTTTLASQELASQISDAREAGNKLEVEQSTLSNPTRIKTEASALGMYSPNNASAVYLSRDVVVTDDAGALSLSGSVSVAALG